jgi:hypothetical protein
MREMVEEAFDICLNHPLRPPVGNDFRNPPQRIMRAAPRAKARRAVAELGFPDRLQEVAEPILDQAVLEARHPERSMPPVPLGDIGTPHRQWLVAQSAYPRRQVRKSRLHALYVVVFPDPIDSRRFASVLSPEALAQTLGVKQQPHQGGEPRLRLFARHQCETLKFGCHGLKSSRRRAVCRSRVVSNRHPQCCARITGCQRSYGWLRLPSTTTRVLALTLVHGCPPPTDRRLDLPGYRVFSMSGSTRPRTPGSTGAPRHRAAPVVAYRRDKTVATRQPNLSGLNTFKVGFTRYLCTSPAFVPTHRLGCYQTRRKARYWARGSRIPRRDSHPLEHAALPGRTVPNYPRDKRVRSEWH